jgi:hypothetical protein
MNAYRSFYEYEGITEAELVGFEPFTSPRFRPPSEAYDKPPGLPVHRGAPEEKISKERDEIIRSKLTKILTAEQSTHWQQLLGNTLSEPFHR